MEQPYPFPMQDSAAALSGAPNGWELSLRFSLDSAFYIRPVRSASDTMPVRHLLATVGTGHPQPRETSPTTVFYGLLLLYLVLLAASRFYGYPGSRSSRKISERLLPNLLQSDQNSGGKWDYWWRLVALCLGFTVCLVPLFPFFNRTIVGTDMLSVLLGCAAYVAAKQLLRFVSSLLLDVEALSQRFARKKCIVYYNMLLVLVPLAFVHYQYPFGAYAIIFAAVMVIVNIYLLINKISIYFEKMKLYGIFLYFCTLEIMPVTALAACVLKS